jgi:hypothetical protein
MHGFVIARPRVVLSSRRSATKTRELRNLRRARRSPARTTARADAQRVREPPAPGWAHRAGRAGGRHPRRVAAGGPHGGRFCNVLIPLKDILR